MKLIIEKSIPNGSVSIPGSKSHTIRALFFAALANGTSLIKKPLVADDVISAIKVLRQFGAKIVEVNGDLHVTGFGNRPKPTTQMVDVGNSGTTLRFAASVAALIPEQTILSGDKQIQKRPIKPLLDALNKLGAKAVSLNNNGSAPISVFGPINGSDIEIECVTSQYLSSLLITLPLVSKDSTIVPVILNEKPYIDMTLWWLDRFGIKYLRDGYSTLKVFGDQEYNEFQCTIPGDFSSATFFMVLAAISKGTIILKNLWLDDPQGDKEVLNVIKSMGAKVGSIKGYIKITGGELTGKDIDLNAMPDALPALAVLGCFAKGQTRLLNVPQARSKETDRISVMCSELKKMGADIHELADGLVIKESRLHGADLCGNDDHRIVMALSLAGAVSSGQTSIDTAEAINITFPSFVKLMNDIGVCMKIKSDE